MKVTVSAVALALTPWHTVASLQQRPLQSDEKSSLSVAIIGAGAAGSSAAYHLAQLASAHDGLAVNITVFEKNDYIGGRSTTISAYDDPTYPVELGASIFVQVNEILVSATRELNLSTSALKQQRQKQSIAVAGTPALGIWDGESFRLIVQTGNSWRDLLKLFWKYGRAPLQTLQLMKKTIASFLQMYNDPIFPFRSLTNAVEQAGLLPATTSTGMQFLAANGVKAGEFANEVIQASTRVNYAQNLDFIHGLEAMVCMATEGAMAVEGGNWRIFEGMLNASRATVRLKAQVQSLALQHDNNGKPQWVLNHAASESSGIHTAIDQKELEPKTQAVEHFDAVILATPFQFSGIELISSSHSSAPKLHKPDMIPYVTLHVTLFTSQLLLSPSYFNLSPNTVIPRTILTTLPKDERPQQGSAGQGSLSFFSISLLDEVTSPSGQVEYVYKIFSRQAVSSAFLREVFGDASDPDSDDDPSHVSWIYRHVWQSYPYEYPRVTFEAIRLDRAWEGEHETPSGQADPRGLYYTAGMDAFISTMETNALMGKNVAGLIVEEWLTAARSEHASTDDSKVRTTKLDL